MLGSMNAINVMLIQDILLKTTNAATAINNSKTENARYAAINRA